jgi:uncharacterized protein
LIRPLRDVTRPVAWRLGALVLLLAASVALAQPAPPPAPSTFFTDTTSQIPADVAARLEAQLRAFEKETSNQILVVVGDRVPEGYGDIAEYANRTAQAWRAGVKERDNGAILFVFLGDRKMRLEVGYGLEGALPDALASRIINDEIGPQFRAGRYGEGLVAGVDAILRATKGEYKPIAKKRAVSSRRLILLVVLFFLFVGVVLPALREIDAVQNSRTYSGRGRHRGGWGGGWGSGGGGGWSGGGGSWGGGGGFSGGGGSFGGGGASGSW